MSWYTGQDGQQTWVPRDEMVYTVIQPAENLQVENLTYLSVNSKKAVYQEHIVDEDLAKGSKRSKNKAAGRQRGFVVRVDLEEQLRVVPWFKEAANQLLDCDVVSKVDADEAANMKKKKKNDRMMSLLGVNECRVETTARIHHFAHGPGFRVEVAEGTVQQKIHFFTNKKEMRVKDWHACIVAALEYTGAHVMLARRSEKTADEAAAADGTSNAAAVASAGGNTTAAAPDVKANNGLERFSVEQLRRDKAQQDDDAWLQSVMNGCAVISDGESASEADGDGSADEEATPVDAAPKSRASKAPPVTSPAVSGTTANGTRVARTQPASRGANPATSLSEQRQLQQDLPEWRRGAQQQPAARPEWLRPPGARQQHARQSQQEPAVSSRQGQARQSDRQQGKHPQQEPAMPSRQPQPRQAGKQSQAQQQEPAMPSRQPQPRQAVKQPPEQRKVSESWTPALESRWRDPRDAWREEAQTAPAPVRNRWRAQRREEASAAEAKREEQQERWEHWEEAWREEPASAVPARPGDDCAPSVRAFFQMAQQQERGSAGIAETILRAKERGSAGAERERRDEVLHAPASSCAECNRGLPLKLFKDDDDEQWYCRMCWVNFYGVEPPGK